MSARDRGRTSHTLPKRTAGPSIDTADRGRLAIPTMPADITRIRDSTGIFADRRSQSHNARMEGWAAGSPSRVVACCYGFDEVGASSDA
jgi:hypothetical protein